jgi:DNA-directed RNA polymerase specialized sigma24 family protein
MKQISARQKSGTGSPWTRAGAFEELLQLRVVLKRDRTLVAAPACRRGALPLGELLRRGRTKAQRRTRDLVWSAAAPHLYAWLRAHTKEGLHILASPNAYPPDVVGTVLQLALQFDDAQDATLNLTFDEDSREVTEPLPDRLIYHFEGGGYTCAALRLLTGVVYSKSVRNKINAAIDVLTESLGWDHSYFRRYPRRYDTQLEVLAHLICALKSHRWRGAQSLSAYLCRAARNFVTDCERRATTWRRAPLVPFGRGDDTADGYVARLRDVTTDRTSWRVSEDWVEPPKLLSPRRRRQPEVRHKLPERTQLPTGWFSEPKGREERVFENVTDHGDFDDKLNHLAPQDRRFAKLLAMGFRQRQIAQATGASEAAVSCSVSKLRLDPVLQAMAVALGYPVPAPTDTTAKSKPRVPRQPDRVASMPLMQAVAAARGARDELADEQSRDDAAAPVAATTPTPAAAPQRA